MAHDHPVGTKRNLQTVVAEHRDVRLTLSAVSAVVCEGRHPDSGR
jgi:hypothetical protein